MRELCPESAHGIAYRTYRVWGDFWRGEDSSANRTPPLYHYGITASGGALIIAPCSVNEVESFFASLHAESSLRYKIETSELGPDWIGFWCLFSVIVKQSD